MHARRSIAGAAALLFAAACSGTTTQTLPTFGPGASPSGRHVAAKRERAKLSVRLKIPKRHRRAHYVSPNTQSIVLLEGTTTLGTFNTTPNSADCAPQNGATICTFTTGILTGANKTFVVQAYDLPNGTAGNGKLLSSGSIVKTIVAGMNVIPVTLSGVVSSIAVAVQNPNTAAGTAAPALHVTVMANDPDGNTIVGPGAYSDASGNPLTIALSDSDTSGVTALSATSVTGPNDRILLNYNGGNVTKATIGASANGIAAGSVTPGVFQPTPVVTGNFVLPNAIGTNTNTPTAPQFIITGPDGNLWFTDSASNGSPANAIVKMTPAGAMTQFVPGTAPSNNLPDEFFDGLAAGPDGNVWYASNDSVGFLTTNGVATDYPLSGLGVCSGNPVAASVTAAQDGGLWFTINCGASAQLLHMTPGGTPTVSSLPAGFDLPNSIIVGQDHKLYIAGTDSSGSPNKGAIVQVTISGTSAGTSTMIDVPSGALNPITGEQGLTQTPDGDLWVANNGCASSAISRLHLLAGFSAANVTTFPTLAGCSDPANLMALADGSIWVPEYDYPEALQLLPAANEGAPSMFALTVPTPQNVYGELWSVAATSDGTLYFTNDDGAGSPVASGNIVKVVY